MLPPAGGLILCAVSGGRDSMALLHLLAAMGAEEGFRVAAAHFNHLLRPVGAFVDEAFVEDWCRARDIPFCCERWEVRGFAGEWDTSLEDAARRARYLFLEKAADRLGADRIATAHHREDNAETVLLHLLRGAGLQGLGGIPPVRGRIVRPLLETSRDDINAYIRANSIPYVEDETNREPIFTRNRLRLEALPLLEEIFPGCTGRLAGTGELLREENEHLQREAEALLPPAENGEAAVPLAVFDRQDLAIRRRLVHTMGKRLGVSLSRRHVEAVLALPEGGSASLPEEFQAIRGAAQLVLRKRTLFPPPMSLREGEQIWGPWRVTLERVTREKRREPIEEDDRTVVLRPMRGELQISGWTGGERLRLPGANGERTLKRLYRDKKLPPNGREAYPALFWGDSLAAVFGIGTGVWAKGYEPPCWVVRLRKESGDNEGGDEP